MDTAEDIAASLNRWAREGINIMGGSESHALEQLLDDYYDLQSSHPGKLTSLMIFKFLTGNEVTDEDFESHYRGTEDTDGTLIYIIIIVKIELKNH